MDTGEAFELDICEDDNGREGENGRGRTSWLNFSSLRNINGDLELRF
jgi:hypothetical protein